MKIYYLLKNGVVIRYLKNQTLGIQSGNVFIDIGKAEIIMTPFTSFQSIEDLKVRREDIVAKWESDVERSGMVGNDHVYYE